MFETTKTETPTDFAMMQTLVTYAQKSYEAGKISFVHYAAHVEKLYEIMCTGEYVNDTTTEDAP